jgi:ubiquinone/menaquinone biosynthesis C-methylase UbiE
MANKKKPFKMFFQVLKLFFSENNQTGSLVQKSYDRISTGYDETWTHHMRDLTSVLIDKLDIKPNQITIDLTCGTGYATQQIAQKTGAKVIGVDNSKGMLEQARQNCPESCDFVHADILEHLKTLPSESFDSVF